MSFIDDFDEALAAPEDAAAEQVAAEPVVDDASLDYFDREDEPVIW